MTPEEAKELLTSITRGKFALTFRAYLVVGAVGLVSAFVGSLLSTKAQNYATKQDLAELTEIAEQIRSNISDSSWQSQRFWEEKKLVYVQIIKAMDQVNMGLMECELMMGGVPLDDKLPPALAKVIAELKIALRDFSQNAALAGIFLSPAAQKAIEEFRRKGGLPPPTANVIEDGRSVCRSIRAALKEQRVAFLEAARADLEAKLTPSKIE
jgi:hypothetical protein